MYESAFCQAASFAVVVSSLAAVLRDRGDHGLGEARTYFSFFSVFVFRPCLAHSAFGPSGIMYSPWFPA
jgi:hypothetical protein